MTDDINDLFFSPAPTKERPLTGLTALLVEDSRFASEAIRLMMRTSGARMRRADCVASARRHLGVYRPGLAIIDIGLPDGSGLDLILELKKHPGGPIVLATSGSDELVQKALNAGADGFLSKPIPSLSVFQNQILSILPTNAQPPGLRVVHNEQVDPDLIALRDDLMQMKELLSQSDRENYLSYICQFSASIANETMDQALSKASGQLQNSLGTTAAHDCANALESLIRKKIEAAPTI